MPGTPTHDRSEDDLLREAQEGSSVAFGMLAQRYRPALMRLLSRRLVDGAEAEDLVQETLSLAYAAIDRYDRDRPFGAWLTTIAVRVAATHGRRRRERVIERVEQPDPSPLPGEVIAQEQERRSLWTLARDVLPQRQYEALRLRYRLEMTVEQIAAAMGIRSIHVRVLLYRARRRLLKSRRFCETFGWASRQADDGDKR